MDPSYPAPTSTAPSCLPLSEPYSHMKGLVSNKAKMLWWRLIFLAVGEAHNHKPILPDTLLCLCLSPHGRVGITFTTASGSSSYVLHPTSRVLRAGGGSRWKGSPEHVASACSVSPGASGVICPAALCLVVGLAVVKGWSTLSCFCATVSLRNFVFQGVREVESLILFVQSFHILELVYVLELNT